MNQLGEIWEINKEQDFGKIRILSKEKYDERISFKPSSNNIFSNRLEKVHVSFDSKGNYELRKFNFFEDHDLLDSDFFRAKGVSFSFTSNRNINKIIIDYQLYHLKGAFEELERLKLMIDRVDYYVMTPVKLLNSIDISKLLKDYKIIYKESGYDKPGGKSSAGIGVRTDRPYPLDNYLKKLLPKFDFTIASGTDSDYNCLFSSDILSKMENEISKEKIEDIKKVCLDLTDNIKKMAMLLYNETEHAESIRNEYHVEYSRMLDKCITLPL